MHPIIPHLWFDKEAKPAAEFYTATFPHSKILHSSVIYDTPSGDCDLLTFSLAGQTFMAISAGPLFKINPSLSFYVNCESEAEITKLWEALSEGGFVLMPFDTYPWGKKYGWLTDKYGVSWQLIWREEEKIEQKILPTFMFTQENFGNAKAAIEKYTSLFPASEIHFMDTYGPGEGDKEGFIKHAQFTISGTRCSALESSLGHAFTFNEAVSLIVTCDSQEEIDQYWNVLSKIPEAEQCGWCKDEFGVSWQIVPSRMQEMMSTGTPEQITRVTQAFLPMKKFDIAKLEEAFHG